MAMAKIKKGDKIVVLAGKDKGASGEVTQVMPKDGKLLVDGINVHAKHRKPTQENPQGGIDRKPRPCIFRTWHSPIPRMASRPAFVSKRKTASAFASP